MSRTSLRAVALADMNGLRTRHTAEFAVPRERVIAIAIVAAMIGLFAFALYRFEFSLTRIINGIGNLGSFVPLMFPPSPGSWPRAWLFLHALAETVAIAFLGTLLAAILAFPLGFLAARNTTINRVVQFMSRRMLDSVRGVDALIWALIWINVVGLGPFAGVLAIMSSDIGAFGKLFSEAIEAADNKPVEGVTSSGGSHLQQVRFGVLPQVLPVIAGQILYYFESNTRSSTIIGIVGAGGIGLHLSEMIRTLEWPSVSFIICLILVTVAVIDAVSGRIRRAIVGPVPQDAH
ncbi:phosphate-import permease protein PhnE [Variibacter gotjawalensis]|uniref:Phosphate-import permease protein PhnE n=1 Tax=Variibacter gotjawalensis TaxID=1333996 RepID=A0A0S3PT19_9BRAD|nr:phosphonate ABC transporter, permease protein PhnE [Variibacter gotjawalensis]NIK49426.1 phosphonate transport system permease protein [Variibacter gotjawalensis]RZS51278.1 phosphonate transport system permease protein [Variibacter gotjawalensis]BAT59111.1 phosphate-import permease protein PhnE [Variibacter gotjawalensis]